jgi:hypothetical protein
MTRSFVGFCVFIGLLLTLTAAGCSDVKKETKIPETEIPLPKEGPMPAGAGGGKAAPKGGGAPAIPSETAQ